MIDPKSCRNNANSCIEMANDLTEPEMRDRLLALATEWLKLAGELEHEATEYEQMLAALRRHFDLVPVYPNIQ
jgi:nitrate reductase assembly molybdenum cofactor insertion protein NarJ